METLLITKKLCKKCNVGKLSDRVSRGLLVKTTLFWLPIKRYKCDYCDKKSYVMGANPEKAPQAKLYVI